MKSHYTEYVRNADAYGVEYSKKTPASNDALAICNVLLSMSMLHHSIHSNGVKIHCYHRDWVLRANDRKARRKR